MPPLSSRQVFERAYATAFTGSLAFSFGAVAALSIRMATRGEWAVAIGLACAYAHLSLQLLKIYYYLHEVEQGQGGSPLHTALRLLAKGSVSQSTEELSRLLLAVTIVVATKFTTASVYGGFPPIPLFAGVACFVLLVCWDRAVWRGLRDAEALASTPAQKGALTTAKKFFDLDPDRISFAGQYRQSTKFQERLCGFVGAVAALIMLWGQSRVPVVGVSIPSPPEPLRVLAGIGFAVSAALFWYLVGRQRKSRAQASDPLAWRTAGLVLGPLAALICEVRVNRSGWAALFTLKHP